MTDQPSVLSQPVAQVKPRKLWLLALLLVTHLGTFLAQLPTIYEFANFVFFDPGVTLRTDKLIQQGYIPTVDFGYPYSLLPLMIGRGFFAVAGRTPAGYILFMFLAEAAILFGLWRLASHGSWWVAAFLVAAMPHAIIPVYVHLTHPLEAVLIVNTIADLAEGRRARALALATICLFVKPSMAYVLGFLILVLAIAQCVRQGQGWKSFLAFLRPAIIAGTACLAISSAYFGVTPTVTALIPVNGAQSYKALGFGFFGNGKTFWLPRLSGAAHFAKYYSLTPAGFWIICTLLIAVFGVASLLKLLNNQTSKLETIAIVAICHFVFLFTFFGWPGSWTYYSSLLVAGTALGLATFRVRPVWIAAMIVIALAGNVERYQITVNAWKWMHRSPASAGLWAFQNQQEEWNHARTLAGNRRIFYFNNGCAELLYPNIDSPISFFLSPNQQAPIEFDRIRHQLDQASVVVTFNQAPVLDPWNWPEFAAQREQFVEIWRGVYVTVHERKQVDK
ncbi:MAG: hypothetical protein JST85_30275 [Acidobacteria bacterium]|nr:hypothetical protein [Acidobacteriota bacterium]